METVDFRKPKPATSSPKHLDNVTRLTRVQRRQLKSLSSSLKLSHSNGELALLEGHWYVTHAGLLRIAVNNKCLGIHVEPIEEMCDPGSQRWVIKAVVYTGKTCRGFEAVGDADPSNVSPKVYGAEMRIAETRAVNRALRKAYAVGICSYEELGPQNKSAGAEVNKQPVVTEPAILRRRLCSLIANYGLNATAVKRYAAAFCGTQEVREATRELVEDFIDHLSLSLTNDRKAVIEHLKQYENAGVQ